MKYSWSRSKGILPPWSTWVVILKVQAQEAALLNAQDKDNVIVRSAILSNDLKPEDVSLALFEKKTDVQDVMLDIVFVAPSSQQQSSLHVPPLEDQGVRDTTIMVSSQLFIWPGFKSGSIAFFFAFLKCFELIFMKA